MQSNCAATGRPHRAIELTDNFTGSRLTLEAATRGRDFVERS